MFTHIQTLSHYKSCPWGTNHSKAFILNRLILPHIELCLTQTQKVSAFGSY